MTTDFLSAGWLTRLSFGIMNSRISFRKYQSPGIQGPCKHSVIGKQERKEKCQVTWYTVAFWEFPKSSVIPWECFLQWCRGPTALKWNSSPGAGWACATSLYHAQFRPLPLAARWYTGFLTRLPSLPFLDCFSGFSQSGLFADTWGKSEGSPGTWR